MGQRPKRRLLPDISGATAIEFALVVGPLLLLVFGTVEFGRLMWTREALHSAAIAGARCMGVKEAACASGGTLDEGTTRLFIRDRARALYVSLEPGDITLKADTSCSGADGFAQVSIDFTFQSLISPLLDAIDEVELKASAGFPNQS